MLTESSHTVESWVKHQHLIWMYSTRSQQALNSKIASNILAVELRGHRLWDIKKCQTLTQVSPASEFSQSIANLTAASLIKQMISHCHIRSHHQTALEATSVLVQNTYNIKSRPRRNATKDKPMYQVNIALLVKSHGPWTQHKWIVVFLRPSTNLYRPINPNNPNKSIVVSCRFLSLSGPHQPWITGVLRQDLGVEKNTKWWNPTEHPTASNG